MIKRIWIAWPILMAGLGCNLTAGLSGQPTSSATPAPALAVQTSPAPPSATAAPEVYVPTACQGEPIATLPAATTLAMPTPGLLANPALSADEQLGVLDEVTSTVAQNYLYPDFNGMDWQAATAAYRAQVQAGMDTDEFYAGMKQLITALGDEHSKFETPADVAADEAELAGIVDYVGIGVFAKPLLDGDRATVLGVLPGSSAEHSGLRAHDDLLAVDGCPLVENGVSYPQRLRGPQCSAIVLTVQSPGAPIRDVTILRDRISVPLPIDAHLVQTADGARIGYVFVYSLFDTTLQGRIESALSDFGAMDGLILDFRMNGGGAESILRDLLGLFTSGTVGEFKSRAGNRPLVLEAHPIGDSQTVPLVVLVGKDTVSYGEVFSGILQDQGRAKIVGETTDGNVVILHGYTLSDDSQLWIAQERFVPAVSHANWEVTGIVPEVEAVADWDTYTADDDPVVAAALRVLGH